MANNLYNTMYNPDVLSCIANLSSDEVFTPPDVANAMLDMLPQELFSDPNTTFLDPACKSGVFLREIAKRLLKGLEKKIPDLQERTRHIFKKQLYGIAITELTSHLSRRSLYCSKTANGNYSVVDFNTVDGNIRFKSITHTWKKGKCIFCKAAKEQYNRGDELESHAYEFIHAVNPEEIFKMKFDVIISNPPYHLGDGGNSSSATPIYNLFIERAKKLGPRYLCMIIPARWYSGGKGLDSFRDAMLSDKRIKYIRDYVNSKDCFDGLSISGGICYFLWEKDYHGDCRFVSEKAGKTNESIRKLDEFPVFVRYDEGINIIHKVMRANEASLSSIMSSRNPFGIPTSARGKERPFKGAYKLYSSKGEGYISEREVLSNLDIANRYKVMITRVMKEHAGEPDKNGQFGVLATIRVLKSNEVCTDTYITAGKFRTRKEGENLAAYLRLKFVRFLLILAAASINLSKETYKFVPKQDFSKTWTDAELYKKYKLTKEEIDFIESMIKPMDADS